MSHSSWIVRFSDWEIKHFEYDGTSGIVLSNLFNTFEEMSSKWRNQEWKYCTCGWEEKCMAYSTYWSGFYIECLWCRKCQTLRSTEEDFFTFKEDEKNPRWAEKQYEQWINEDE